LPNALLERGSANIEWQIQTQPGSFNETHDRGNDLLERLIATDQIGARELVL
jgi:hypothetical protein